MHCDELIRELAVPTDDRDSAALSEHLATCPSCARWAQRDAQFDRLWNATRPTEPSEDAWDTVWAQITTALDSSTPAEFKAFAGPMATTNGSLPQKITPFGLTAAPSRSKRWNWAAIGLIGLAQAAAVLLAVGWTWRDSTKSRESNGGLAAHSTAAFPDSLPVAKESRALLSSAPVEIEAGQTVVIQFDDAAAKIIDHTPDGISYSVDDWLLVFNAAEAFANPVVAMH